MNHNTFSNKNNKQIVKELVKHISDTKLEIHQIRTKLGNAEIKLDELEVKLNQLTISNKQAEPSNTTTLTIDTARVGQRVRILNSPFGTGKIVKKNPVFGTVKLDTNQSNLRRYYSKLQLIEPDQSE